MPFDGWFSGLEGLFYAGKSIHIPSVTERYGHPLEKIQPLKGVLTFSETETQWQHES